MTDPGDDDRAAVIRASEELTKTVTTASGEAQAQRSMEEARRLRAIQDFKGAIIAVLAAARLFDLAGLSVRADAARAEANHTEGEALILESENLYAEGALEGILVRLQRAEILFLAAAHAEVHSGAPGGNGYAVTGSDGGCSEDDDFDVQGPRRNLDALNKFRSRINGDMVMQGVEPALDAREYDLALRLMLEADGHYAETIGGEGGGRWMTSVTLRNSKGTVGLPPRETILKRAVQDGERLRKEAAAAIQKEKNPVKAQQLLSAAEECMAWAGVDPVAAGAAAVAKDINAFQSRAAGDEICRQLIHILLDKDFERANVVLQDALDKYRQVGTHVRLIQGGKRCYPRPNILATRDLHRMVS